MKIEFTEEEDARVIALPESDHGMSNADHSIADGLEGDLRAGMKGRHAAWNFNGLVWLEPRTGLFCEVVRRYHVVVGVHCAASLKDLMGEVNDTYGWD